MPLFKKSMLLVFLTIILVSSCFLSVYLLEEKGFFKIVEINWTIEKSELSSAFYNSKINGLQSNVQGFVGESLLKTQMHDISDLIKSQNWIESHQIRRLWPSRVRVEIIPKKISLLLMKKSGGYYPVTEEGELLSLTTNTQLPDKILLVGENFEKQLELRKKAIDLVKALPEKGLLSADKISEIRFDQQKGFQLSLINSDSVVRIGDSNFVQKISRSQQVLEYLENQQLQARVIDSNLTKKVLVRLRKGP